MTTPAADYGVEIDDIRLAARRIAPHAHVTPVLTCSTIDEIAGRSVFFKCENFQKVGAFKFRGACNAVMNLSDDDAARAVVTHSSGNHAQALALAARIRGVEAHIVMPRDAMKIKRRAVEDYGGIIHESEQTTREKIANEVLEQTGGVLIPPYDYPDIIAGQGTAALELHDQVTDLDAIIAPIGGGGLMSGTSITTRSVRPRARIFGAEPAGADDAARSLAAGEFIPQTGPDTIADGLLTSLGKQTWPIIRDHVEHIFTVSDDEIVAAMRLMWERMKIIIEPSAAVPVAAVLSATFQALDGIDQVGVILSGGNVDLDHLPWK